MNAADPEWSAKRRRAIEVHAAEQARRAIADAERAGTMLREFVAAMRAAGAAAVPLRARSYHGRYRYRTGLTGWYLRPNLAVDDAGRLYILSVRASLVALVRGVTVPPAQPRLVIGEGGRDGDRITLRALLDKRLAEAGAGAGAG